MFFFFQLISCSKTSARRKTTRTPTFPITAPNWPSSPNPGTFSKSPSISLINPLLIPNLQWISCSKTSARKRTTRTPI